MQKNQICLSLLESLSFILCACRKNNIAEIEKVNPIVIAKMLGRYIHPKFAIVTLAKDEYVSNVPVVNAKSVMVRGCPEFCVNGISSLLRHPVFELDSKPI